MAARKGPRKLCRYSAEFKLKAVKLSQIEGVRVQDVADALEIHPFILSRWRREARGEIVRLRRAGRAVRGPLNADVGCPVTRNVMGYT